MTDAELGTAHRVERSDRVGVYDGFLKVRPDWVIVIENKPCHTNIWEEQLSSAFADAYEFEPKPIDITWSNVIQRLGCLIENGLVHDAGLVLVEDFLSFVARFFRDLSPFNSFRLCGDHYHLLEKHCNDIMAQIDIGAVEYHRGWYTSIRIEDKPGVKEASLHPDKESSNAWPLALDIHPGDTVVQARSLYATLDQQAVSALVQEGWSVTPNFHIAFRSSNLHWSTTGVTLSEYIEYWKKEVAGGALRQIPRSDWKSYFSDLAGNGIISTEDIQDIEIQLGQTNMSTINVCPGIGFHFEWSPDIAVPIDDRGVFHTEVKSRVVDVLGCW